jgi:hypothetical protein
MRSRVIRASAHGTRRAPTARHQGDFVDTVDGDFHAWLTPEGEPGVASEPAQRTLATLWEPWIVGRSPGLGALVDLNECTESELMRLPQMNAPRARAIIAARPFRVVDDLARVPGIDRARLAVLRPLVTV